MTAVSTVRIREISKWTVNSAECNSSSIGRYVRISDELIIFLCDGKQDIADSSLQLTEASKCLLWSTQSNIGSAIKRYLLFGGIGKGASLAHQEYFANYGLINLKNLNL